MLHRIEPKNELFPENIVASNTFLYLAVFFLFFIFIQIIENCAGCFELTLEVLCF